MAGSGTSPIVMVSCSEAFREASYCKRSPQQYSFPKLSKFLRQQESSTRALDAQGNTILHILAIYGNVSAFQKVFNEERIVTGEDLMRARNIIGNTPLHEAARFGQVGVVNLMLEMRNGNDLVLARNNLGETPIYVAASFGKKEVFDVLKQKIMQTDLGLTRSDKCTVLHAAITGEYYSLAMSILESFPHLVHSLDEKGMTALYLMATKTLSFKSTSSYLITSLGRRSFIPLQLVAILVYACIPSMIFGSNHAVDVENQHQSGFNFSMFNKGHLKTKIITGYRRIIRVCAWIREVDDAKQEHTCALALAKMLVKLADKEWSYYSVVDSSGENLNPGIVANNNLLEKKKNKLQNPLVQAGENGIIELVKEILGKFPEAAYSCDKNGKNLMHIAVEQKNRVLYGYLRKNIDHKDRMLEDVDNEGNNVLHLAANLGSSPKVFLGQLDQMTWEICWFKHVCIDCPPHLIHLENSHGMTPMQVFEIKHTELRQGAEKAVKDIANSLMLVAALYATGNYAAFFTIPGGYEQDSTSPTNGRPILLQSSDMATINNMLSFLRCVSSGMFFAFLSLGTMLSIYLSRFRTNDFYVALPFRFIVAMATLGLSMAFTPAACFKAVDLFQVTFNKPYYTTVAQISFAFLYVDAICLTLYYLYFVIRDSLAYKGYQM